LDRDLSLRFLLAAGAVGLVNRVSADSRNEEHNEIFDPTELGLSIGSINSPGRGVVLLEASPEYGEAWDNFDEVLRTGGIGWQLAHGVPRIYDSIDTDSGNLPKFRDTFYEGLKSWGGMEEDEILSADRVNTLIASLPLTAVVVDVGGGEGSFASKILCLRPDISVVLQEQSVTCDAARSNPMLKTWIATDRLKLVERCFFDGIVVENGSLYILKYILHNWGDEDCISILRNIRVALQVASNIENSNNNARVLIIEHGPIESSPEIRLLDLHMAVLCGKGASERTTKEYSKLVEASGLTICGVHPSKGGVYAIECGLDCNTA